MVGSATNRLCQFWQYACVYECVNVHLETFNGQYTDMSTYTHTHTYTLRIMGGRNLLRPHPLTAKETPSDLWKGKTTNTKLYYSYITRHRHTEDNTEPTGSYKLMHPYLNLWYSRFSWNQTPFSNNSVSVYLHFIQYRTLFVVACWIEISSHEGLRGNYCSCKPSMF